jgi:hypothetical protein
MRVLSHHLRKPSHMRPVRANPAASVVVADISSRDIRESQAIAPGVGRRRPAKSAQPYRDRQRPLAASRTLVVLRVVRDLRACPENRRLGRSLLPPTTSANRLGIRRVPPHGGFSKLTRGDQFGTTRVMGEWDTLICRVPVSASPIMTRALANIQIVINRLLRSLCITKGPPLVERRAPPTKGESTQSPGWAQASPSEARLR